MDYELTFLLQKENKKKFDLNLSLCSWLCLTRSHGGSKNREQLVQTASRVVFFCVYCMFHSIKNTLSNDFLLHERDARIE
jgi:hypothetical protein